MAIEKESLESQISGTVLVPGDEGYEESLKRWSAVSEKNAGYVAFVQNSEDISKTVRHAINYTYVRLFGLLNTTSTSPFEGVVTLPPVLRLLKAELSVYSPPICMINK